MTTINLYQNPEGERKRFSAITGSGGLFFSIGILIVTILAFGGIKFAVYFLDGQNKALIENLGKEKESMAGLSNLEQIINMQTRLSQIKSNLNIKDGKASKTQMTEILGQLGSEINAGIVLSSYKYENGGKITLTFEANNFSDVARQILNFKSSKYFADINIDKISRGEKSIACNIGMNIKQ